MKNYQFAILALIAAAFVAVIYMKTNRKHHHCGCMDATDPANVPVDEAQV
jgi:hypothetical protein